MPAPYHNLGSKLDRAIVAYLISAAAGTAADILPANSRAKKNYPVTVVQSRRGIPNPDLSGNYLVDVRVMVEYSAVQEPNEANAEKNRVAADLRLAKTYDALMQSDNDEDLRATCGLIEAAGRALVNAGSATDKANNADMADFSINGWYDKGFERGEPDQEGCAWVEVLNFQCSCVPSNVD